MKKILVLSDIHRAEATAVDIISSNSDVDAIIFLGDGERSFENALAECGIDICGERPEIYQVAGNCDWTSREAMMLVPEFEGVRICISHGHGNHVKSTDGIYSLASDAKARDCTAAIFGHTHKQFYQIISGIKMFNPGAVMNGCYGIIEINHGDASFVTMSVPLA